MSIWTILLIVLAILFVLWLIRKLGGGDSNGGSSSFDVGDLFDGSSGSSDGGSWDVGGSSGGSGSSDSF